MIYIMYICITIRNKDIMTTTKTYKTGNVSTGEYFTITELGSLNAYIKLYDVSGFLTDKIIPLKEFKNWVKNA